MLKRARPSDSLDDCKWERTKVFQASRDLIFISWSHHYRVMNLVGNLRRGAGIVGPLSPSKSSTAKQVPPPSPSLAPSPSQQDEDAALLAGLDFSMMTFSAGVDQAQPSGYRLTIISFCRYRVIFEISLKYRYRIFLRISHDIQV